MINNLDETLDEQLAAGQLLSKRRVIADQSDQSPPKDAAGHTGHQQGDDEENLKPGAERWESLMGIESQME